MSDTVIITWSLLGFLLLVFLILVIRFPEVIQVTRITQLSAGPEGVSLIFAERAITEKEHRSLNRRTLRDQLDRLPSHTRILWVDNNPANNLNEIIALKVRGLDVTAVTTNAQAADALKRDGFALVISDIGRTPPEEQKAGLDLPNVLATASKDMPPIVYYVGQVTEERVHNKYPVTNRPSELFQLIAENIKPPVSATR